MFSTKKLFFLGIVLFVLLSSSSTCLAVNPEPSWVMWSKTYGGAESENTSSMVEISDGHYVILADRFLLQIDSQGNVEWNKTISESYYDITSMLIQTVDGGLH